MTNKRRHPSLAIAALFFALSLANPAPGAATYVSLSDKASLQATMQRHIDSGTVDGKYLRLNETTGQVHMLNALSAHPVILRMGEYFVLCSDFERRDGGKVNIDFYLAWKDRGYFFDELMDKRGLIRN